VVEALMQLKFSRKQKGPPIVAKVIQVCTEESKQAHKEEIKYSERATALTYHTY